MIINHLNHNIVMNQVGSSQNLLIEKGARKAYYWHSNQLEKTLRVSSDTNVLNKQIWSGKFQVNNIMAFGTYLGEQQVHIETLLHNQSVFVKISPLSESEPLYLIENKTDLQI